MARTDLIHHQLVLPRALSGCCDGQGGLDLFIRSKPTDNAPLAEGDEAMQRMVRDRFGVFVEKVARPLAGWHRTLVPDDGE